MAPKQVAQVEEHGLQDPVLLLANCPTPQSLTHLTPWRYELTGQVTQVCESEQVAQVESQTAHLPLLRYLPSTHPGTQVVNSEVDLK